jgi:hypothetical protein
MRSPWSVCIVTPNGMHIQARYDAVLEELKL